MKGFNKVLATAPQYKVVEEQDANWDPTAVRHDRPATAGQVRQGRRAGRVRHGRLHGAADHPGGQAGRLRRRGQGRPDRHRQQLLQGRHRLDQGGRAVRHRHRGPGHDRRRRPPTTSTRYLDRAEPAAAARSSRRSASPRRTWTSSPSSAATHERVRRPAGPRSRVEGLARAFNGVPAVREVSFTVGAGEIHALCGHNGAGKSTVVKMLSGQLAPDRGRIVIGGEPVELRSRQAAQRARRRARGPGAERRTGADRAGQHARSATSTAPLVNRRRAAAARCRRILDGMGLERISPRSAAVGARASASGSWSRSRKALEPERPAGDPRRAHRDPQRRRERARVRGDPPGRGHGLLGHLRLPPAVGGARALRPRDRAARRPRRRHHPGRGPDRGRADRADARRGAAPAVRRPRSRSGPRATRCGSSTCACPGGCADFTLTAQAGRIYALAGQLGSGASDVAARPRRTAPQGDRNGRAARPAGAVPRPGRGRARRRRLRVQRPQVRGPVPGQADRVEPGRDAAAHAWGAAASSGPVASARTARSLAERVGPAGTAARRAGRDAERRQPAEGLRRALPRPRATCSPCCWTSRPAGWTSAVARRSTSCSASAADCRARRDLRLHRARGAARTGRRDRHDAGRPDRRAGTRATPTARC